MWVPLKYVYVYLSVPIAPGRLMDGHRSFIPSTLDMYLYLFVG